VIGLRHHSLRVCNHSNAHSNFTRNKTGSARMFVITYGGHRDIGRSRYLRHHLKPQTVPASSASAAYIAAQLSTQLEPHFHIESDTDATEATEFQSCRAMTWFVKRPDGARRSMQRLAPVVRPT
jgi:hypothetical protein